MDCKLMDKCQAAKPGCRDHIANAKNCFIPDPAVKQSPETCEADVRLNNLLKTKKEDEMYEIKKDGNAWCATGEGFINLQESIAGFGDTPLDALTELLAEEVQAEKERRKDIRCFKCNNCQKEFGRGTAEDVPECPACRCGKQFVNELPF